MASAKGGSGKTSLAATFATFLSRLEKKVLLIDADFATNGLTLLFLKEVRVKSELIFSTGRAPASLNEALLSCEECDLIELSENLHLIPASFNLQASALSVTDSTRKNFKDLLSPLRETYDYIFIDAQAGADDMGQIAMNRGVSDEVVIVSEYDPMSAAGVERLKGMLREDLTYDRTWVLLNKILPEFAKSFSDFLEVAKYLSPVPWDAEVVRAYTRRRLAIDTETGNQHTLSVLQTLKGLCGESIQKEISTWVQTRAAVIRQPLEKQYSDAETEMAFLIRAKSRIQQKALVLQLASRIFVVTAITSMVYLIAVRLSEISYTPILEISSRIGPYIISVGMVFLIFVIIGSDLFASFLNTFRGSPRSEGVQKMLDEARYDRQLEITKERLKRLELLRTLDPETLLKRSDFWPDEKGGQAGENGS